MCNNQPVGACTITLEADNGARYTVVTDAQGSIALPEVEEGHYTVHAEAAGHNYFTGTWTLDSKGASSYTISMQRSVLNVSAHEVNAATALESQTAQTITLENAGNGDLQYNLFPIPVKGSGNTDHRWDITQTFDASGDIQSCVAFDGEDFYASSNFFLGKFYKYSRDGHFVEEFSVPGMYYALNDMTFDGRYFYASDRKNRIFQLDLRHKRLIGTIDIPTEPSLCVTHIAHDPRSDEFWVGDYNTLGRVNRKGEVTLAFYKLNASNSMDVYGTAFDNVTPGGPYLWMSNLVTSGLNVVDKVTIVQYDLNNRRVVGNTHSAVDVPGYKPGSLSTGENSLGGLECTTSLVDGQLTLLGILNQSPARVFAYKLADFDPWLNVSPLAGTLKAGEKQTVTLNFDARNVALNQTNTTTLQFKSIPELTNNHDISISLTANQAAPCPPTSSHKRASALRRVPSMWDSSRAPIRVRWA